MLIKQCIGHELEKEKSNTSEDFFNRSEVTFVEDGKEKTLHVLYVRYFDELAGSITPFEQDPIFKAGSKEVYMRDLVALAALLKNPGYRHRKRVYINQQREFADIFKGLDYSKLPEVFEGIEQKGSFEVRSPLDYIVQPV
ncbi:hypothetical protein [Bacillus sp. ISL-55]|uniref:hypothetical protein n=1 Tax=Bacillus sp. ISL-55 TaxID=2819134 RepID=UPI001BE808FB|nr:hypothetical protein [Bacillus sp. ISL-55]MBT2693306.1 hypothetical protein [Bacillus sp. ISL-55]